MCDNCGRDHDDLDRDLAPLLAKMSEGQKQTYLMLVGMIGVLREMDAHQATFVFRHEIVKKVNEVAKEDDIEEAVIVLAKNYGIPL